MYDLPHTRRLPAPHPAPPRSARVVTAPPPFLQPQPRDSRAPTVTLPPGCSRGSRSLGKYDPRPPPGSRPWRPWVKAGGGTSRQALAPGASHFTERTPENKSGADLHHSSKGGLSATEVPKRRTSPSCPVWVAGLGAAGEWRETASREEVCAPAVKPGEGRGVISSPWLRGPQPGPGSLSREVGTEVFCASV